MRIVFALGGTDWGGSGIGIWVRAMLPRMAATARARGDEVVLLGTAEDLSAYSEAAAGLACETIPRAFDHPATSALYYLGRSAPRARRAGGDVLLLPAANRRLPLVPGAPTVAVVHDLAQLHVAEKYDPFRMVYFTRVVVPALRAARRLVAVSEATRTDLRAAIGPGGPPNDVVPNGVEHERFPPAAPDDPRVAEARTATGLDEPYLLYASRLEHPGMGGEDFGGSLTQAADGQVCLQACKTALWNVKVVGLDASASVRSCQGWEAGSALTAVSTVQPGAPDSKSSE